MATRYYPPVTRPWVRAAAASLRPVIRIGHTVSFFARAVAAIPAMLEHYRRELVRIQSDITWGNGSIVVGGGTAGVIVVLGASAGAIVGIEAYNALDLLGMGPATGMISSIVSTRELAPVMAALAFAAQAGCRFTAQLGAMRISEEIDAMEALAIRPIPYLVTTRLVAAAITVLPLYVMCLAMNFLTVKLVVLFAGGGAAGTYSHYFGLALAPADIVYSVVKAVVFVVIATTIQCYYGFYAAGGPQGVGIAAGRAMRASITVMLIVNMLLTMAFWGFDAGARFGG
ncbi:ABC transporter permease [Nocardia higoensis]|uniref:ABC transporter permease n=1 Tax=Nocardia higoensis TaxID=228599 RepID=A0ABS0DB54_9NOCA|nr:ABC transporter permease [Nocardia higoensis]MBF6355701.1 ABC transporter permease [Nocardia higoensis]